MRFLTRARQKIRFKKGVSREKAPRSELLPQTVLGRVKEERSGLILALLGQSLATQKKGKEKEKSS